MIPVNELPAEVQNDIITKADLIELKKKGQVFNQGDRDGYSFYLIDCEINLVANGQVSSSIKAATDRSKYPMAQLQPPKQEQSKEEQEKQLMEERLKLEAEQKKIQAALQEVHKAKAEAEALKRAALAEVTALKAKQAQSKADVTTSDVVKEQMQSKIKAAQEKLAKASEKATEAEKQEEEVAVAQKVNQEDLVKKKAEEEALAKQLQADLADFKEELEEQEREYANSTTQLEHMKRIRERAMSAKKAAEDANNDLLSDISSQLTNKD